MLNSFNDVRRFDVVLADGTRAALDDIYFDADDNSTVYGLVDIGSWLAGQHALVRFGEIAAVDTSKREIPVDLTEEQVKASPTPEDHLPVNRRGHDEAGAPVPMPPLLIGARTGLIGALTGPIETNPEAEAARHAAERRMDESEPALRSMYDLLNYRLEHDGERLGRIEDFIFDPHERRVRYVVGDGGKLLPGKRFVLAMDWLSDIDDHERTIEVDVTSDQLDAAPPLDEIEDLDRSAEARLYRHFNAAPYWV